MEQIYPGVHVEEVESSTRPLEGVGTAVAAFVGLSSEGPLNTPLRRAAAAVGLVVLVTVVLRRRRDH